MGGSLLSDEDVRPTRPALKSGVYAGRPHTPSPNPSRKREWNYLNNNVGTVTQDSSPLHPALRARRASRTMF